MAYPLYGKGGTLMTKRRKAETAAVGLFAVGFSLLLFFFPAVGAESVSRSLSLCARSIVPSLFLFAALSQILVKSGLFSRLGAFARPLGLSPGGFAVALVGIFCGFPTGAAAAATLCESGELSRKEAAEILPICGNAGMAFVVGTVGESFWGDRTFGVRLFLWQTGLSLVLLLLGAPARRRARSVSPEPPKKAEKPVAVLVSSVAAAGGAMVTVASFLLFFGAVADYLLFFLRPVLPQTFSPVICSLLELGRGCAEFAAIRGENPLPAAVGAAWSVGFSGLSVVFQNLDRAGAAAPPFFSYLWKRAAFGFLLAFFVFLCEIA